MKHFYILLTFLPGLELQLTKAQLTIYMGCRFIKKEAKYDEK